MRTQAIDPVLSVIPRVESTLTRSACRQKIADAANLPGPFDSRGLRLTTGGILFGAVVALPLTRLMGPLLYKVSPHDPLEFGSAVLVMTITAISACLFLAWRASRIDPARVLRH
jgi:hypothetical protein